MSTLKDRWELSLYSATFKIKFCFQVPVLYNADILPNPLADSLYITLYIAERYPTLLPAAHKDQILFLLHNLHDINYFSISFGNKPGAAVGMKAAIERLLAKSDLSELYKDALEYKLNVWVSLYALYFCLFPCIISGSFYRCKIKSQPFLTRGFQSRWRENPRCRRGKSPSRGWKDRIASSSVRISYLSDRRSLALWIRRPNGTRCTLGPVSGQTARSWKSRNGLWRLKKLRKYGYSKARVEKRYGREEDDVQVVSKIICLCM